MLAILDQYSQVIKFSELPDPTLTWELQALIGEGTYGEIHRGIHRESGKYTKITGNKRVISAVTQK
jgi:hypothetical protein